MLFRSRLRPDERRVLLSPVELFRVFRPRLVSTVLSFCWFTRADISEFCLPNNEQFLMSADDCIFVNLGLNKCYFCWTLEFVFRSAREGESTF